jgi:hypothetical protein
MSAETLNSEGIPQDEEFTSEEDVVISELVKGGYSMGEARKLIIERRKARDLKALNEDISPEKAKKDLNNQ